MGTAEPGLRAGRPALHPGFTAVLPEWPVAARCPIYARVKCIDKCLYN